MKKTEEYKEILIKVLNNISRYKENNANHNLGEITIDKIFIIGNDQYFDKDGWVDSLKNIYLKQHIIDSYKYNDNKILLYWALTHELVHVYQYRNFWTFIYYKLFRNAAEYQASTFSKKAEDWIKRNCQL